MRRGYCSAGGVEFGFMSCSPKKSVAMFYAEDGKGNDTAIVYEIKMGMLAPHAAGVAISASYRRAIGRK